MLRKKKEGPRTTLGRFLPVFATLILLIPFQNAYASVQTTSGTVHLGNTFQGAGNTAYSVDYSYPSTAAVGTNLTVTVTLHVDSLTGIIEYMINWYVRVNIDIAGQAPLNNGVNAPNGAAFQYPGASLGPLNITIPLNEQDTGLAKGQSTNATVTVILGDYVYLAGVIKYYETEPLMQAGAGSLVIQDAVSTGTSTGGGGTTGPTYVPYALLAAGVVLMLSAVFLPRAPRPPQAT